MDPAPVTYTQAERLYLALLTDATRSSASAVREGMAMGASGEGMPTLGQLLTAVYNTAMEVALDLWVREPAVAAALLEAVRELVHAGQPVEQQARALAELARGAALYREAYDNPDWRPE